MEGSAGVAGECTAGVDGDRGRPRREYSIPVSEEWVGRPGCVNKSRGRKMEGWGDVAEKGTVMEDRAE